jgi:hypothetical protein
MHTSTVSTPLRENDLFAPHVVLVLPLYIFFHNDGFSINMVSILDRNAVIRYFIVI